MAVRFDRAAADRALTALRAGAAEEVVADYAGISLSTLKHWMHRRDFGMEVKQVKAELAVLSVGVIRQAVPRERAAAQFFVERLAVDQEIERLRALTTDSKTNTGG